MPTRDELLRLAEQADRDAVELERHAAISRDQAKKLREMADEVLPMVASQRSMLGSKMELQNAGAKSKRVKIAAKMTEHETPAKKALFAANVTPQEIADELGVGRSTVNAWCNGTRSIPRRYRERLLKKRNIPVGVWPNQAD